MEQINENITLKRIKTMGDIEELAEMIAEDMGKEKIGHVAVHGAEATSGEAIIRATRGKGGDARFPVLVIHRGTIDYSAEGKAGHVRATHNLGIRILDKVDDRAGNKERREKESSIQQTFEEFLGRLERYSNTLIDQTQKPYVFHFDKIQARPVSHLTVNNEVGFEGQNIRIGRMGNAAYFPPRRY